MPDCNDLTGIVETVVVRDNDPAKNAMLNNPAHWRLLLVTGGMHGPVEYVFGRFITGLAARTAPAMPDREQVAEALKKGHREWAREDDSGSPQGRQVVEILALLRKHGWQRPAEPCRHVKPGRNQFYRIVTGDAWPHHTANDSQKVDAILALLDDLPVALSRDEMAEIMFEHHKIGKGAISDRTLRIEVEGLADALVEAQKGEQVKGIVDILEDMRRYEMERAEEGMVPCPMACHGFGVCSECHDTGWVYAPLVAAALVEAARKQEDEDE